MNRWVFGLNQLVMAVYVNMLPKGDEEGERPFGILDIRARAAEDYGVQKERRPGDGTYDRARSAGCSNVMLAFDTSDDARHLAKLLNEMADAMDKAPVGIDAEDTKDMDRNV